MPKQRTQASASQSERETRPALTAEGRESQLIAMATNLAEEQMRNGTASSQVITHYLKLAATKEKARLELDILEKQKELIEAKTQHLQSAKRIEELYEKAMGAMRNYSGTASNEDREDDYEYDY